MSGNGNKVLLATTNKCSTNSAANFADDERNHLQQSESDNFEVFDYNFASHFGLFLFLFLHFYFYLLFILIINFYALFLVKFSKFHIYLKKFFKILFV